MLFMSQCIGRRTYVCEQMCLYFFQDRLIDTDYVDDQLTKTDPVFCINNVVRRVFERSTLAICGVFSVFFARSSRGKYALSLDYKENV